VVSGTQQSGFFGPYDIRKFFFDRDRVQKAIKRMGKDPKAFEHYAGYMGKVAKNSIKHTKAKVGSKAWRKPSRRGKPPRSRDPQKRLKKIYHGFDPSQGGVIVGPVGIPNLRTGGTTVPSIHEKAKTVLVRRKTYAKKTRRASKAQAKAYVQALKTGRRPYPQATGTAHHIVKYPRRPFMWPAAQKTAKKFPRMWAAGVTLK
jgi:hypothetical protein